MALRPSALAEGPIAAGRLLLPSVGPDICATGLASSLGTAVFAYPLEKVAIRTQGYAPWSQMGLRSGLSDIWRNEGGLAGLYRGFSVRAFRSATTTAPRILLDEAVRSATAERRQQLGAAAHEAACGALAGGVTTLMHWPFDRVRLVLQVQSAERQGAPPKNWMGYTLRYWRQAGPRLFSGCWSSVGLGALQTAVLFAGADCAAAALRERGLVSDPVASVAAGGIIGGSAAGLAAAVGDLWPRGVRQAAARLPLRVGIGAPVAGLSLSLMEAGKLYLAAAA
eukprot:TRINITY_DN8826_c0_g1_i1.p1 TRINITY_DN8826_c0_g1~~TRINITY_DN8826_c0_g1_i1.p1  ORF type:complete len:307 (+),score=74.97 TRINITY_DN8826_c0_g1_i1:81-923(+)